MTPSKRLRRERLIKIEHLHEIRSRYKWMCAATQFRLWHLHRSLFQLWNNIISSCQSLNAINSFVSAVDFCYAMTHYTKMNIIYLHVANNRRECANERQAGNTENDRTMTAFKRRMTKAMVLHQLCACSKQCSKSKTFVDFVRMPFRSQSGKTCKSVWKRRARGCTQHTNLANLRHKGVAAKKISHFNILA